LRAGVFFAGNRQAAWEHGVEACFTSAARAKLLKVAIRLEPAEGLGAQRDDVMAGPEPGEKLEDQRPETLLDRIGIGFVARGLVRNRIGQKGVTRRVLKFAGGHEVCGSLGLPGPQHPLSHELAPGPDQRLAKFDLVLAQVAPEDADRSLERAGIENRLKRVFLEPFVDRDIDGKLLAAGTCADLLTQFFDRRGQPAGLLRSVFDPGRFIFGAGLAAYCRTFRADAEGVGLVPTGGKLLDLPRQLPARQGLRVIWTGVEDHPPEPPGLDAVTALLGHDGEVAQGEVAVDALVDATELVRTLQGQDPPPAGFGLGPLGSDREFG